MAAGEWVGDYWLTSSGAMATDAWVDGGRYYVGASGAWVPGMQPSTPDKPSQPEEKVVTLDQPSDFRYDIRESGAFIVGINYDVWDANGWWNDRVKPKVVIPARIEGKEVVSVETYNAPYGLFALDVSGCLETLEKLDASGNSLETLNLSGCTALKRLDCSGNCLASLELLNCPSLEVLECRANQLESLQIDSERLRSLDCSYNQLSLLGISDCNFAYSRFGNHYGTLNISNNKFTSLGFDLSNFGGSITCYGNNFDSETKAVLKAWGERDGNTLDW